MACNVVIQTSFLGDTILSLPFIERLLEVDSKPLFIIAAPRNEMVFRVALQEGLYKYSQRVSLIVWDKKMDGSFFRLLTFAKQCRELFKEDTAHIFCLQRSFRSGLFAYLLKAPVRVGFSSGAASFFYSHNIPRSWDEGQHEIQKNLNLLIPFYGEDSAQWTPASSNSILKIERSAKSKEPIVALSLSSPWPTKQWPIENAIELCRDLLAQGVKVILLGDQKSSQFYKPLVEKCASLLLVDLSGQTNFEQLVNRLAEVDLLISGDSAAVHIASDLNIPVISLFGPTIPQFGFAPWRSHSKAIGLELPCRPCDIHGPRVCPLTHHRCLKDLSATLVLKSVLSGLYLDRHS